MPRTRSGEPGPYWVILAALMMVVAALPPGLSAQEDPTAGSDALRVFLECRGQGCDQRVLRTEIDWVNWVRDREDAQLHLFVTNEENGSGGRSYELDFIGLEALEGVDDLLTYASIGTDVRDETVRGLTRVISVGLGRYSVLAGFGAPFDVVSARQEGLTDRLVTSDQVEDPWNFWVFEVDLSTNLSGETSRSDRRFNGGIDANRTTTTWKVEFDAGGNWRRDEIQLTDSVIVDNRRDWDSELSVVYSVADHWSLGGRAEISAATRTNQDLSISAGPRLEFSVWPYEEAPRRSLRVRYDVGVRHFEYEEITLFDVTEETRPVQSLEISINQRQPWGTMFLSANASHYLHDMSKNRVRTGGFISFRIVRGLQVNLFGNVEWIRDQLFIAAEDITDEEILLQRRRLASDFDWSIGTGFSFQFGSIFNNVVNNRF